MFARSSNTGLDSIINRERPSWWSLFFAEPTRTLARTVYSWKKEPPPRSSTSGIAVVCISDTHNTQPAVPEGDILIHAGDLTQSGSLAELQVALDWIDSLPHAHKIVIGGNHDNVLDAKFCKDRDLRDQIRWGRITYLENSSVTLRFRGGRSIKVYGTPLTPEHGNWGFQYPRVEDRFTNTVPDDIDILVTHGPPRFHLDLGRYGDGFLLQELWRVRPSLHIFGHIHEGYGRYSVNFDDLQRCYENVLRGTHGIVAVIYMVLIIAQAYILGDRKSASRTTLINASAVGGLRDHIRREAIVEYI